MEPVAEIRGGCPWRFQPDTPTRTERPGRRQSQPGSRPRPSGDGGETHWGATFVRVEICPSRDLSKSWLSEAASGTAGRPGGATGGSESAACRLGCGRVGPRDPSQRDHDPIPRDPSQRDPSPRCAAYGRLAGRETDDTRGGKTEIEPGPPGRLNVFGVAVGRWGVSVQLPGEGDWRYRVDRALRHSPRPIEH